MGEDCVNVEFAPSNVFSKLRDGLKKISRTDGISFVETYLADAHARIQIEPKNQGSELKISYNFARYWTMLTIVLISLIPIFLVVDKFVFGGLDPISVIIPLIMLAGWYFLKGQSEKKKKEKILKRVKAIIQ